MWFGEALAQDALRGAFYAARTCDLFLSVGTSWIVQPAASLPLVALRAGAAFAEVNPNETPLTPHANYMYYGAGRERRCRRW